MLGWARPEDCPELCKRRVELELTLLGESMDYEKCVKICRSMLGTRGGGREG